MNRLTVLLTVGMLVLAGCAGGAGSDSDSSTATATATPTPTATSSSGSSGSGSSSSSGSGGTSSSSGSLSGAYDPYDFRAGQYYRYDVNAPDDFGVGTFEWEVLETSEESVTVRAKMDTDETKFEQTVTSPPEEVYGRFMATPAGALLFASVLSPGVAQLEGEELSVGDGWSYSGPDGSVSVRVERLESFGGLDCGTVVARQNGTAVWENCVSPDSALPGHTVFLNDEGSTEFEMTLVEYRPGA